MRAARAEWLRPGGDVVVMVEHPIMLARCPTAASSAPGLRLERLAELGPDPALVGDAELPEAIDLPTLLALRAAKPR